MRLKHLTFKQDSFDDADAATWTASQERWLAASIAATGLCAAWGSADGGAARAVFLWESEDALRGFMERDHARALTDAGTVGKHAVLYLELLEREGSLVGAEHVAESVAWVRDGGVDDWLAERRAWAEATRATPGFRGSVVGRGRHAFFVTTFWATAADHERYVHEVVPVVRAKTDEGHTVRLVRYDGSLSPSLTFGDL